MNQRAFVVAAGVGWLLTLVGPPLAGRAQTAAPPREIQVIASPAATPSGEPQLSVSSRGVLLSWIERAGAQATLKFAERAASGWSAPRVVASGADWFVNWADVPSVMRLSDGTLAAHWLQKSGPGTYAYDVRLAYSKDDGRTWSASFLPHHDGTKTEHGFASLFEMPAGGLGLVWLDGRAMAGGGAMTVRSAAFNRSWTQTADLGVDLRVCECCPTTAAVTSDGPIVAFRNRTEDEIRDIYVSRFEGGRWTEPKAVHDDGWRIASCPVNGPAIAARGRDVVLAWFTMSNGPGQAFAAFSTDGGRSFGPPIRVDEAGALGRVDVDLLPDGRGLVTWIEYAGAGDQAEFRMRGITRSGARGEAATIAKLNATRASGYPRLARHGDELVFAWVEVTRGAPDVPDGTRRVRTAVSPVPAAAESTRPARAGSGATGRAPTQ